MASPDKFVVYYDCFDEDRILFVKNESLVTKNDVVIFQGDKKQCRIHALQNQPKGRAKSLRNLPPCEDY